MEVHKGLDHLPSFKNAVLTIGSFDGVHMGHRTIIRRLVAKAKEVEGESILLTFDPHPRQVVFPNDKSIKLLNNLDEKIQLLRETGLNHLVIATFTIDFSQINPYKYVDDILIDKLNVQHLIIGYDHRFGQNRAGNIELLNIYAKQGAFTVEEIEKQDVDELHVSSTKIRTHILAGEIERANKLLGKPFIISGQVSKGSQIAGGLGFPTANCSLINQAKIIPSNGTYIAVARCKGIDYNGMLYIGKSPTLQNLNKSIIEMNLFATIEDDLYGEQIEIRPLKKIRGDIKFDSKTALLYNINQDKLNALHYFDCQEKKPQVTTAILNYNGKEFLNSFVAGHKQNEAHEVLVIDNASGDDSVTYLKTHFPEVDVTVLKNNLGFAAGYNEGLKSLGTKYVAIVNSDVDVTQDWLRPIISLLESDAYIAAVQPKIKSYNQKENFEYAGAAGGFIDSFGYPLCRGRIVDTVEKDEGQYDQNIECFWASGAAIVVRTDLFKFSGGFDGDFFAHMEEIDLCWRLKNAGYKIMCCPESTIYHVGGGTLNYNSPRKVYLNLRNNYWMLFKNMPTGSLLTRIPVRLATDSAYALLQLLGGRPKNMLHAFKGILHGLTGLSKQLKKKKTNQLFINRYGVGPKNKTGMISMLLPISYKVFGKKKFNQIK